MTQPDHSHDLELTVSALKDGVQDLGDGGTVEIDRWVGPLQASDDPELAAIAQDLTLLRTALTSGTPGDIATLLQQLGDATVLAADKAGDVRVAGNLRELGNLLTTEAGALRNR